jgi:hypothetical protein
MYFHGGKYMVVGVVGGKCCGAAMVACRAKP